MSEEELQKLIDSAESGDMQAQNDLGYLYAKRKDYEKAFYWYKMAAD